MLFFFLLLFISLQFLSFFTLVLCHSFYSLCLLFFRIFSIHLFVFHLLFILARLSYSLFIYFPFFQIINFLYSNYLSCLLLLLLKCQMVSPVTLINAAVRCRSVRHLLFNWYRILLLPLSFKQILE